MGRRRRGGEHIRAAKLNLVDLAGSERQGKTGGWEGGGEGGRGREVGGRSEEGGRGREVDKGDEERWVEEGGRRDMGR